MYYITLNADAQGVLKTVKQEEFLDIFEFFVY